tara:strand:+ start:4733 stop:5389 length:657 start_codon:yes stop_codon:yes gene_type:complete
MERASFVTNSSNGVVHDDGATLYSVPSSDIHVLVPNEAPIVGTASKELIDLSSERARALPPLARRAMADLAVAVAAVAPLSGLRLKAAHEAQGLALAGQLAKVSVHTVGDLLTLGPDEAAARIRGNETREDATLDEELTVLDALFVAAERTLDAPFEAAKEFARKSKAPLTRVSLSSPAFLAKLSKRAELSDIDAEVLEKVAREVAEVPLGTTTRDTP